MKRAEALQLVEQLESLIGDCPGVNERKMERCRSILWDLRREKGTPYLNEKASTVESEMAQWFSARKWMQAGSAEKMHYWVLVAVKKLEGAVEMAFPE